MALTKCQECDGQVSDRALACPHCGFSMGRKTAESSTRTSAEPPPEDSDLRMDEEKPRPGSALAISWTLTSLLVIAVFLFGSWLKIEAGYHVSRRGIELIRSVFTFGLLLLIPTAILYLAWLYQTWRAVPAEHRSISPGMAVGLLFVPIFNLYWMFRAGPGLSMSIQRALRSQNPKDESGAGFAWAVAACLLTLIPYINALSWPLFVVWIFCANAAKNRMLRNLEAIEHKNA